ncbi:hypothetical protein [Sulfurovum mangrovi]|uniref:hypothetical protein n=1 Tax=Sulfurovum mangrovi TaxID=2893889 RepID=UPI001E3E531C|nr:hypothetical protein [Sulfurovum mangrovi]UFH60496.1 hypothetical protein LN246_06465 [Sulfurovum mangrovi]
MKKYKEDRWLYRSIALIKSSLFAVFLVLGFGTQATAWVHPDYSTNLFELDGNITDDTTPGDDWTNVKNGTSGAFATTDGILEDGLSLSIFTGGGSKDIRDIPLWKWTQGSVPDKDEILHAAAAAYNVEVNGSDNELIIYLMGDRYSTDGSAQMGVWFFQENVRLNHDDGTFIGKHQNGDVLMLAEFTQGGVQANIKLYKWDDTQKNNLFLFWEGQGDPDTYFYALSNGENTPAWSTYTPKSGTPGIYPPNSFFEGGINLSWIFDDETLPCFSSFLMETRSSHRANAQLKDFVLGELNTCKLEVAKVCVSSEINTADYTSLIHTYEYNVTNSGFGTIDDVTFSDDAGTPNDTSDDFDLPASGPLAIGETYIGDPYTNINSKNPPTNRIYATGHIGDYKMAAVWAEATCDPVDIDANISVTKECVQSLTSTDESNATIGYVVVRIDYNGIVCNDKNGTKLVDVNVTDDVSGETFGPFDLYPADDANLSNTRKRCEEYSGFYYPSSTTKACAVNSSHTNTVTATGNEALTGSPVMDMATATCKLCDDENCTEQTP